MSTPNTEPPPAARILPLSGKNLPPSKGGPTVRLWDKEFRLLYSNTTDDRSFADVMKAMSEGYATVDADGERRGYKLHEVRYEQISPRRYPHV